MFKINPLSYLVLSIHGQRTTQAWKLGKIFKYELFNFIFASVRKSLFPYKNDIAQKRMLF